MSEWNTIYDVSKRIVGIFRHGVAWSKEPRTRLGEYDYGDVGSIYDNDANVVGRFDSGAVTTTAGAVVGRFVKVPFEEFENGTQLQGATITRLDIGDRVVGWCIGNPGSAAAAIFFIFDKRNESATT